MGIQWNLMLTNQNCYQKRRNNEKKKINSTKLLFENHVICIFQEVSIDLLCLRVHLRVM